MPTQDELAKLRITAGNRAVSIRTDEPWDITLGCLVSITAQIFKNKDNFSSLVIEGTPVLASSANSTVLTIAVSPQEADIILKAGEKGKLEVAGTLDGPSCHLQ